LVWACGFEDLLRTEWGPLGAEDLDLDGEEPLRSVLESFGVGGEDVVEDEDKKGVEKSAGRKRCGRNRFGFGKCKGERNRMGWATQRSWEVRG
jgi:hypothetical protein